VIAVTWPSSVRDDDEDRRRHDRPQRGREPEAEHRAPARARLGAGRLTRRVTAPTGHPQARREHGVGHERAERRDDRDVRRIEQQTGGIAVAGADRVPERVIMAVAHRPVVERDGAKAERARGDIVRRLVQQHASGKDDGSGCDRARARNAGSSRRRVESCRAHTR